MKKTLLISSFALLLGAVNAQNVNIPDANFKAYLVGNTSINTNSDTEIQVSEANALTGSLNCSIKNIADLTGIEAFTSITQLSCYGNQLTSLDLTSNTNLTTIQASYNQLTSINITGLTALSYLEVNGNQLGNLNLSTNTTLRTLFLSSNPLISIDLSANAALEHLYCESTTTLTALDLSNNIILNKLEGSNNSNLTSLNVSNCSLLSFLNISSNKLNSLDVSDNTALTELYCQANEITSIDLSANTNLTKVELHQNLLTTIDLSNNPALTSIKCLFNDQLTSLNIKNGNNGIITTFDARYSSNLACIQVDDSTSFSNLWNGFKDTTARYSTNCNFTTNINENMNEHTFSVYPNPANNYITINSSKASTISIFNLMGQEVLKAKVNGIENIDISQLKIGLYFIKDTDRKILSKFIKY